MNRREFSLALFGAVASIGMKPRQDYARVRVNAQRITDHLAKLAEFGKNPGGGVSRVAYTEADRLGRQYVSGLMTDAKLEVSIDAAGNIVGRRGGREHLPPLMMGSHTDSVPDGGNYDGDVGSLSAIETARTLADNDVILRHPIEVVIFQNEEGGTYGSRAIGSGLTEKELDLVSQGGKTIREGIKFIGGDPDRLAEARRKKGDIAAYLELHIEQGGILDAEKIDIGVVEGIVGIKHWDVKIEGFANHAGTTPMRDRRDALLAAARFIDYVNRVVTRVPGTQVGTVGKIQALPGAYNVIPGTVTLGLELRDLDSAKIDMLFDAIREGANTIHSDTGTTFEFTPNLTIVPAPTSEPIRKLIADSARELRFSSKVMPSGAGHDAQEIARIAPVGMIFIPSVDGISHSPREFSRPEDIANGANVLLQALIKLDSARLD
jgi:N-carbamoyl-L-amino-acid hydrolase